MSHGPDSRVRQATAADVGALVALMGEFYAEAGYPLSTDAAARTFGALLGDARLGAVWLADDDDEDGPAGFVVLTVGFSMEYGGLRGFLDDLFVRADRRGEGLAGALVAAVWAECVRRGVRALYVEVGADNAAAHRVYARAGMEDTGRLLLAAPLAPPVHEA